VLAALEDSRRVTHAALYIVDPDGSGYELAGHIGPSPTGAWTRWPTGPSSSGCAGWRGDGGGARARAGALEEQAGRGAGGGAAS
jgi:hypothetical protein